MAHPATTTINNLYQLFERAANEMTDEEILKKLREIPDPEFNKEINQIKLMRARALAKEKKEMFMNALGKLKHYLAENSLASPKLQQAQVMYRKLQRLEGDDQQQLLIDQKLLDFISELDDCKY
jgi:hypothetical protein